MFQVADVSDHKPVVHDMLLMPVLLLLVVGCCWVMALAWPKLACFPNTIALCPDEVDDGLVSGEGVGL